MKRFQFRLQTVLDHAIQVEEECLQQLARLQNELYLKSQEIVRNRAQRTALKQTLASVQAGVFDVEELRKYHLHLEALAAAGVRLQGDEREIQSRITQQQAAVMEARQKRQAMDKLREKQLEAYHRELAREELQVMEEAVLPRQARERAEAAQRT